MHSKLILFVIILSFCSGYNASADNYRITDDSLPGPLIYKEQSTNQTLVFNYTSFYINHNRAYYTIQANTTHSPYLPLNFTLQQTTPTLNGTKILFIQTNYTITTQLLYSTLIIDKATGLQVSIEEMRAVTIPEANITNKLMTFMFGPIDPAILVSNQACNTQFSQTILKTTLTQSYQGLLTLQSNTSLRYNQYISSVLVNSTIISSINIQTLQVDQFNETIDKHFYSYTLEQPANSTILATINTTSIIKSILQQSTAPSFTGLFVCLVLITLSIFKIRKGVN